MTYYNSNKNQEIPRRKNGKIFLSLTIGLILVALSVFYLIQVNKMIAKNFELRNLQKILAQGQKENQALNVSLTQVRSLGNLQQAAKNLNLISIEKATYLKIAPGFFALSD
jgi:hypothetical protein